MCMDMYMHMLYMCMHMRLTQHRQSTLVATTPRARAEYMAPEAVMGKPPTDPRTDLWSFGCLVYRLLTKRHAFDAGSEFLVFEAVRTRSFTFPEVFPASAEISSIACSL